MEKKVNVQWLLQMLCFLVWFLIYSIHRVATFEIKTALYKIFIKPKF